MSFFEPGQGSQLTTAEVAWIAAAVQAGLPSAGNALEVFRVNSAGTNFELAASSGGSGFTLLTSTTQANGSTKSFVFPLATKQPTLIYVDNEGLTATDQTVATNVQWTWNQSTLTATLVGAPPINSIFAIQ